MKKEKKRTVFFIVITCLLIGGLVLLGVWNRTLRQRIQGSEEEREALKKKIEKVEIMEKTGTHFVKDVLRHKAIALCFLNLIKENEKKYTRKEKEDIIQLIVMADKKYGNKGFDAPLILAWIEKESGGDPEAISSEGAKGLTQWVDYRAWDTLMEMGYPGYKEKLVYDPVVNLTGGIRYFSRLMNFWEWKGLEDQSKIIYYSLYSYKWGVEDTEKLFNKDKELERDKGAYVNWILNRKEHWAKKLKYWIEDSKKLVRK
ncbi:lytic transglycosylase domain-containing protein [bacterium]|nr:lytic transglycosylase domain-containing protein [bacterium]